MNSRRRRVGGGEAAAVGPAAGAGEATALDGGEAAAVRYLSERLGGVRPRVGVVLGSGLGGLAGRFERSREIPYRHIPGWPAPGVAGHAGVLVAGELSGMAAVGLSGRSHFYEGHPPGRVALPVRALAGLGIEALLLSNAAGAVNLDFVPGDLMLISDHLNLTGRTPLAGPPREGEERRPDMHAAYDPGLRRMAREAARERGARLREGIYAAMLGPSYESPAEIRMLRALGADAVGMSTVPEVIAARARGIRCLGISCLTNYAAGVTPEPLAHAEVVETADRVADRFERLVLEIARRFDGRDEREGG